MGCGLSCGRSFLGGERKWVEPYLLLNKDRTTFETLSPKVIELKVVPSLT